MSAEVSTQGWQQAERDADLTVELAPGVPMFFRKIPAGEFLMGDRGWHRVEDWFSSEEPRHRVVLTQDFYMGTFPVTQRQFRVWTQAQGVDHRNHFDGHDLRPAEELDWKQGMAFCDWFGGLPDVPPGWAATLPTEARWEYACRAGTTTDYHTGDGEAALAEAGWFVGNSEGRTRAVGGRAANGWGLHDMHGNVWEWCLDVFDADAYRARPDGAADPVVGGSGAGSRVVRGGSWGDGAWVCRSANRGRWLPGNRSWNLGFRLCLLPGPVAARERQQAGAEPDAPERAGGEGAGGTTARSLPASGGAPSGDPWENLRGPPAS